MPVTTRAPFDLSQRLLAFALAFAVAACGGAPSAPPAPAPESAPYLVSELDSSASDWVESTLDDLTLEEAIGQLVFPWVSGAYMAEDDPEFLEAADWVERWGIGGLAISIGTPHSYAAKLNAFQARARVPLLVAADFENGGPGMRINHAYALPSLLPQGGGTSFPPTMAFGAIGEEADVERYARLTALEARAVGVHLNFAPVLDVNSNPENPIINTRAFGEDPAEVARLGRAYLRGARAGGVLTTAKHFPGHGDTRVDSHLLLPEVTADRARLDDVELVPFQAAIEDGVDAVMTAHVSVPGVLGPGAPPATLSPEFMTDLLREELGFEGILFTDALNMGAITEGYGAGEAAVRALEAGADVILIPASVPDAIEAVVEAAEQGRITRERIDASVRRILMAKARVGLHLQRMVPLEEITRTVGTFEHREVADEVATRSITLVRDEGVLVPFDPVRVERVLSVTYAATANLIAGLEFNTALTELVPTLARARIGPETSPDTLASLLVRADSFDVVVLGAYVPPVAGAGSVALPDAVREFVTVLDNRASVVLVSLGNPYLLNAVPSVGTYLLAWGDREVSQRAAARALAGAAAIEGRLPITLPGLHERGEGLDRAPISTGPEVRPDGGPGVGPGAAPGGTPPPGLGQAPSPRGNPAPSTWPALAVSPLEIEPAQVGMDAALLGRVDERILRGIADSVSPGVAIAVGRHGKLVRLRGYGRLDWDPASALVTPFSLYDLASLTKVVGTTTAVMILSSEGLLGLDDPVIRYLPEFARGDPRKAEITVRDLLLHRGGFPPFAPFYETVDGSEEMKNAIYDLRLAEDPRTHAEYSDIGFVVLGWVVEEVAGEPLASFVDRRIFEPLGMSDTGYNPDPSERGRIAPTERDTAYRPYHIHGEVHDENAYAMGGVAGHAGLFSTVQDLAVFAAVMAAGGMLERCDYVVEAGTPCGSTSAPIRTRMWDEAAVQMFTTRVGEDTTPSGESSSWALGWDTPSGMSTAGDYFSERAFGLTGFTGTSLWIDPELDVFVVLLTNRVNPTRENTRHAAFRRELHDLVATSVSDAVVLPREGR